nr:NADH dehydrogenase subunit 1 [Chloeia sp. r EEE-2022]
MILSPFISIILNYVMALLAMAFYTLLERKALGYFQNRKGPNKVSLMGIPQPLADALKLFSKEISRPTFSNIAPFLVSPMGSLLLALILWSLYPYATSTFFIMFGALFFLCVSSLNVYTTLGAGWSSNSKYALLGALRGVAQTISYEVSMSLILLGALMIHLTMNMSLILAHQLVWPALMILPLAITWFITTLAETNRTPFDFAEGESELVSGFNTEFSSGPFALIFMAEYASILIMSLLSVIFFMPQSFSPIILSAETMLIAFMFIWIRASYPRMRYDRLMALTWKAFLPMVLCLLILVIGISSIF